MPELQGVSMEENQAGIPFTIAVDFDGTICEYDFPRCGLPRQDIVNLLRTLKDMDWRITVHSSRVNVCWPKPGRMAKIQDMLDFLRWHDVPWDSVWGLKFPLGGYSPWLTNPEDVGKPVAHVYLDDRAVHSSKSDYKSRSVSSLLTLCLAIAQLAEDLYRKDLKSA